ncbi:hypothetical protein [Streptomyces sp. NPDC012888]|uniref:hypothetical protein n=1 Tax=Streptomyces sp. NPDC012888 TaxID=3364855 RepID=UPI003675B704
MRRGLVQALAWTLATGAAVTLSWWGVHTVMSGTAYDRPRAVPLAVPPVSSSTSGAEVPPPAPAPASEPPAATPSPPASSSPSAAPKPPRKSAPPSSRPPQLQGGGTTGEVRGRTVSGGRVVFDLGTSSAELVSATPAPGWQMQVWKQPKWIRVTFTRDGRESSVFCVWNDHPPMIQVDER